MSVIAPEPAYSRRARGMRASEIRELLKLVERPDIISFAGGIPDPALFPAEAAAEAYRRAIESPERAAGAMQYSISEGLAPLRAWIAAQMAADEVPAAPENIVITAGSQQGLDFLGKLLIDPGDTVLTEVPTYLGALQAFGAYEPRYERLRLEDDSPASAGGRVKLIYLVPDFANPTGETLPLAARQRLLALARELDVPILEDAAYRALRFEGTTLPSLQALDVAAGGSLENSRVIHLGTFSKIVAPGLRVGWICASRAIIRRLVLITQASELNVSAVNQMVMHEIAEQRHAALVEAARRHYRIKRDAMLAALAAHMPSDVRWTRPEGGLFTWLTLPRGTDGAALLERAIPEAGVAFVPGGAFHPDGDGRDTIRLSYSLPDPTNIAEGARRLASLL
jgi:DNA-binding transcriptional MocR family regulator